MRRSPRVNRCRPRVCFDSVVVTANPRVAVLRPRVARVVIVTVRTVPQAKAERGHAETTDEAATVKAAPKATVNKPAARKAGSRTKVATGNPWGHKVATGNTWGRKVATGKPWGRKIASNATTAGEATRNAASPKAAAAETSTSKSAAVAHTSATKAAPVATSTSPAVATSTTGAGGYGIGWNRCSTEKKSGCSECNRSLA